MISKKRKKRFKIGIDIDNCISNSYPAYIEEYNRIYRERIRFEEVIDFYYLDNLANQGGRKVTNFIDKLVIDEEFQMSLLPFEEAIRVITKWSKTGYLIDYVTARPVQVREITKKWLVRHKFWVPSAKLDLFDAQKGYQSDALYKKDVVGRFGIDCFIEDAREIAEMMEIPVFLFDRPWNQGKLHQNVSRVNNWQTVEKLVERLAITY